MTRDTGSATLVEITPGPHHGYTDPKGVTHRTRAPERTVMLVFEGPTVEPTGD